MTPVQARYVRNREKILEKRRAYYAKNRDALIEQRRKYRAANSEKIRAKEKLRWRKKKYGITHAEFLSLLESQGGVCAICKLPALGRGGRNAFCVDHCHKTGSVRGILCSNCNSAIGLLFDDASVVASAAAYLAGGAQ